MTNPTGTDPLRSAAAFRHEADRSDAAQPDRTDTTARTRDEERASQFATHGDPTLTQDAEGAEDGRAGVQWVRPTDLAARAGGAVVDKGAEWNTHLHDAAIEGIREGRAQLHERLTRRQHELDPETTTRDTAQHRVAGRTGVSR